MDGLLLRMSRRAELVEAESSPVKVPLNVCR